LCWVASSVFSCKRDMLVCEPRIFSNASSNILASSDCVTWLCVFYIIKIHSNFQPVSWVSIILILNCHKTKTNDLVFANISSCSKHIC
jgi:hypothetical protein